MQTIERPKAKPTILAERRAATAETTAARERAEAQRLARDLAETRDDRDRWRAQAERLAGALDRLKAPAAAIVPAPVARTTPAPEKASDGLLNGYAEIGEHLGMSEREAKHLGSIGAIPTFKLPGSRIVRARRSSLTTWLAERETAAQGGC